MVKDDLKSTALFRANYWPECSDEETTTLEKITHEYQHVLARLKSLDSLMHSHEFGTSDDLITRGSYQFERKLLVLYANVLSRRLEEYGGVCSTPTRMNCSYSEAAFAAENGMYVYNEDEDESDAYNSDTFFMNTKIDDYDKDNWIII